jgi:hypothetical protein
MRSRNPKTVSTADSLTCFMLVSGKSDSEGTYL